MSNPPSIPAITDSSGEPRPYWSVMIPTYRPQKRFLEQTLESVLKQAPDESEMQIEVVDDCSPDMDVETLVLAVAGTRVKVSKTPTNLGLAGCWNVCLERARGQWVHILHHDDYVLPGFYDRLKQAAAQHPELALLATRSFVVDQHSVIQGVTPALPALEQGGRTGEPFYYDNPLQAPGVVIRRTFYETHGGFRPDLTFVLDLEMWTRAVGLAGGLVTPEVLACFRSFGESETSHQKRSAESLRDFERYFQICAEKYPGFDVRKARRQLCWLALDQALYFSKLGNSEAARANWHYWKNNMPATMRLWIYASRLAFALSRRMVSKILRPGTTNIHPPRLK